MPKLIEKPVGTSREDFDKFPPIITRKVFMACTGISKKQFYILVEQKRIRRLPVGRSGKQGRYYKADAAILNHYTNNGGTHGN